MRPRLIQEPCVLSAEKPRKNFLRGNPMKTETSFNGMTDRYAFDFKMCTIKKGYAQVDTGQDASYYGTWANPTKLIVVSYCEGDITVQKCENKTEFISLIRDIAIWNKCQGYSFGIDPGLQGDIERAFVDLGLKDLLH